MTWRTAPLRSVAEVSLGRQRSPVHASGKWMVPYLRAANVKDGFLDLSDVQSMNFTPAEQRTFSLRPGDVMVTEGSGSISAVGASAVWERQLEGPVCFQNTLLRLRPRDGIDGRFLAWWARSAFSSRIFASISSGANIFHLSADRVRSLPIAFPGLDEQRRIVKFLDAEMSIIDRLVSLRDSQQKLIRERGLSRVYDAVRGKAEGGSRASSRLPWLGDVPASWHVAPVSSQFELRLGKMLNRERTTGSHLRPYLRNLNVQWDRIDTDDLLLMDFPPGERVRYEVLPGDLLICEGGSEPGRAAIWNDQREMYYQKALHRARPRGHSLSRWLYYCLKAATSLGVFAIGGNTTTIAHLTGEQLGSQRFPFPDGSTQARLVSELEEAAAHDLLLVSRLRRQVDLLDERRRALVAAAVAGELDTSSTRQSGLLP